MHGYGEFLDKQIRRARKAAAYLPGYLPHLRKQVETSLAIVMYHGVTDRDLDVPNWSHLHVDEFDRQIHFLRMNYELISLDEAVRRLRAGKSMPPRAACITFDDGFRNVATTAFPVLQKYQAPATVFLITSLVGSRRTSWPDRLYHNMAQSGCDTVEFEGTSFSLEGPAAREASYVAIIERLKSIPLAERQERERELADQLGEAEIANADAVAMMNWDEIAGLAQSGLVDFGSHTHSHPILSQCPADIQREELEISRDVIREHGLSHHLFAYPNGRAIDFTDETKKIAREVGYECAIATIEGLNGPDPDLYAMHRVNISNRTFGRAFEMRMVGL